jgi:hypothetical protein
LKLFTIFGKIVIAIKHSNEVNGMIRKLGPVYQSIVDAVTERQPCTAHEVATAIRSDYAITLKRMYKLGDYKYLDLEKGKGLFTIRNEQPLSIVELVPEKRPPKPRYTPPLRTKTNPPMSIYLFQYSNFHKIGISKDVTERHRKLQSFIPEELIIVHSVPCENARVVELSLHERYAHKCVRGEWFKLDACDVREVVALLLADSQVTFGST